MDLLPRIGVALLVSADENPEPTTTATRFLTAIVWFIRFITAFSRRVPLLGADGIKLVDEPIPLSLVETPPTIRPAIRRV